MIRITGVLVISAALTQDSARSMLGTSDNDFLEASFIQIVEISYIHSEEMYSFYT